MTEFKFTGFIMPQVRFNNEQDAIYTVSCVQSATGRNEFRFLVMVKKSYQKAALVVMKTNRLWLRLIIICWKKEF